MNQQGTLSKLHTHIWQGQGLPPDWIHVSCIWSQGFRHTLSSGWEDLKHVLLLCHCSRPLALTSYQSFTDAGKTWVVYCWKTTAVPKWRKNCFFLVNFKIRQSLWHFLLHHVLRTLGMGLIQCLSQCLRFFTARVWKHWWWILVRPREHLLADKPGHLQAAGDPGRLDWTQDLCRICQLPCWVWGQLLQAASRSIPWQRWRLSYLAQRQAVYHTGQRPRCLHRWVECSARECCIQGWVMHPQSRVDTDTALW